MANQKVASFRVPRAWETNAPKFTSDDPDDLMDFIDQVGEIIELAGITDDKEKKKLLTGYLPVKKRTIWREIDSYANQSSYEDYLDNVYKSYPELKQEKEGTIEDLEKLCKKHQGIRLQDEGQLKRFGVEFSSLFKKLSKQPAIILNKEACLKYLDTLDTSFSNILRSSISARNLLKADINKAAGVQPPVAEANKVDHRKEDPILLGDLMDMAEQLATTGVTGTTWEGYDIPERKRSSMFPVKMEKRDEKLEELGEEVASIRDSILVVAKEAKASQAELLKAFQTHLKDPPPPVRDPPPHLDASRTNVTPVNRPSQERTYGRGEISRTANCFYCDGHDHFSRECPVKIGHMNKGWLIIEDGVQKLGDGRVVPRGRGPTSARVEEYYSKKPTAAQNMYSETESSQRGTEVFYGNEAPDGKEMDAVWDGMRMLQVRLNQLTPANQTGQMAYMASARAQPVYAAPPVVQPTFMAQAPFSPPGVDQVSGDQAFDQNFARAMRSFLNQNLGSSEQYVVTRGGKDSTPQTGPGF